MINLGLSDDYTVMDQQLSLRGRFVVDVGCGDLTLARHLAGQGASVLAVDPDPVQAAKNRAAGVIPNVGFAETTADAIPVEPAGADGVIFSYSLHHIPAADYPAVIDEVTRILKPDGFLYVLEPVASGVLYEVMSLFHNETRVRADAQQALDTLAKPRFSQINELSYYRRKTYRDWEQFAGHYAGLSYNAGYTEAEVRRDEVRERFETLGAPLDYTFEAPMRVTHLSTLANLPG